MKFYLNLHHLLPCTLVKHEDMSGKILASILERVGVDDEMRKKIEELIKGAEVLN